MAGTMMASEAASKLLLTYIRDNAAEAARRAKQRDLGYMEFLTELLEGELERRAGNGVKRRIKDSRFPYKKYLTDFDKSKYDREFASKFRELETLQFIKNQENIILVGTPGAGKTHYAIGLGISACMAGKSVLFASVPNLIVELREAMNQNQLNVYRRKFERYNLVILDELGYVSFDKSGCEMLFHLLTNRHGKGSIIVTTNLSFDKWESVFTDPVLTGAMIDRLAHKAHILDMTREYGGRFEETVAWLNNKEKEIKPKNRG